MHLSLSFVAAALVVSAAAESPFVSRKGSRISLSRRYSATNPDGTANLERLQADREYSIHKIMNGMNAYERNTGSPYHLARSTSSRKRDFAAIPLTVDQQGALWYGTISVGTPENYFTVDFDTGSSDLFLPGIDCNQNCEGHKLLDPDNTYSVYRTGRDFTLSYGGNTNVTGAIYNGTIITAGMETQQAFGIVSSYSTDFSYDRFPADGLMGMAFESISEFNARPFFQSLDGERQVDSPMFAFKLADTGSELFLGGVDSQLYTGDIVYTPVTQEGFWQVDMNAVDVDGDTVLNRVTAIIDTGTTLVLGITSDVAQLYSAIPGSKDVSSTYAPGFWTVPCNAIPTVSLTFEGKSWMILPENFNLGPVSPGSSDCVGGIVGQNAVGMWIVGDVFLRNVYSVFDVYSRMVGFAALA